MEGPRKPPERPPEPLTIEDVRKRIPLLARVIKDAVECFDSRRKAREFLEELRVISRKFSSAELEETMNSLRRQVNEGDHAIQEYEKEARDLGGVLKDMSRGLVYFTSERDGRRIFLIWELGRPDLISWHELDESFSDRVPVELSTKGLGPDFPKDR